MVYTAFTASKNTCRLLLEAFAFVGALALVYLPFGRAPHVFHFSMGYVPEILPIHTPTVLVYGYENVKRLHCLGYECANRIPTLS